MVRRPHGSWEAFDRVLGREVVVNMPRGYTDLPRFLKAARTAASLQHPGFPPVHDLGISGGGQPFCTTPPIRGEALSRLIGRYEADVPPAGGPFPLRPLAGAVRDACRALEHAHRRGLLHLDLHPDRLLIDEEDHVVLDVNGWEEIGAEAGGELGIPRFLGIPAYMSPEQVKPAGIGVGPATDVFGLGGILLFGTPPNHLPQGTRAIDVIRAIAERGFEPRRPRPLRPALRGHGDRSMALGLAAICLKALTYEPEHRYPTAAALGAALDEWLEGGRPAWWKAFRHR